MAAVACLILLHKVRGMGIRVERVWSMDNVVLTSKQNVEVVVVVCRHTVTVALTGTIMNTAMKTTS
jgi:hypothetical protein